MTSVEQLDRTDHLDRTGPTSGAFQTPNEQNTPTAAILCGKHLTGFSGRLVDVGSLEAYMECFLTSVLHS